MVRLLAIAVAVLVVGLLLRATYVFRIVFKDGQVVKQRRTSPGPMRADLADLGRSRNLTGSVALYPGGYLRCSRSISEPDRERIKNVLEEHLRRER